MENWMLLLGARLMALFSLIMIVISVLIGEIIMAVMFALLLAVSVFVMLYKR